MAIMVDSPFNLAFTFYGIPWPDIDEDKVAEFGVRFDHLCEASTEFGDSINHLLTALSDSSRSDAFNAIAGQWQGVCSRDMFPIVNGAGDSVRVLSDIASKGISSYKLTLIAVLTTNIAIDIAALAVPGPGTAAALGRRAAMKDALRGVFQEAADMFAGVIVREINEMFEALVLKPVEDLFARIREQIVQSLAADISGSPTVKGATLATAGALYIDFHDVIDATTKLVSASGNLRAALDAYLSLNDAEDYSEPNVNGAGEQDMTVRTLVKEALEWAVGAIVRLLIDIGDAVVGDLVQLILDTYKKYVEADTILAAKARELHDQLRLRPAPMPYRIDRTTRPKPITVWENPPDEIFTGQAVSDARFEIKLIDLPDTPDPVAVGVARSDASKSMPRVVLPDLSARGDGS